MIASKVANFIRASMMSSVLVSAAKKKEAIKLGPKNPIPNLTKKGLKFWENHFWPKYGKLIRKQEDPDKKIATAIAIWRNSATKHNIAPFNAEETILSEDMKDYMQQRVASNRNKLFKKSVSLLTRLKKKNFIKKVLNEKVSDVDYDKRKSSYFMSTESTVVPEKDINFGNKKLSEFLKLKGFIRKKERFLLSLGQSMIEIKPTDDGKRLIIRNTLFYTPQHIKFILELSEDELKNKSKVIKKLSTRVKKLLKEGKIGNKIIGSALNLDTEDLINFDASLNTEQTEMISKFKETLDKTKTEDLMFQYSLEKILALGDPLYQYQLVKSLVAYFTKNKQEIPGIWKSIENDPNEYLNPRSVELEDEEEEEDPESDV